MDQPPTAERRPVVGLMLPTAAGTDDGRMDAGRVLEAARRAEAAGFDGVYVGDHVLHPRPLLESVVTLTAVATSTQRVSVGPCVMLVALRQTVVLAKQVATLTRFAPGRVRLGVGVGGEYPPEFEVAGVRLSERGRRTETALQQLRALLAGRSVATGPTGDGPEAAIAPPALGDVPFLLAGWKEVSLRRAARLGDGWIGYLLSPESFARRRQLLLDVRAELGRPEPFTTGMLVPVQADHRSAGARDRAAAAWSQVTANSASFPPHLFPAGPPDELADHLREYWDAGCTEVVLAPVDQGGGYLDQLDVLAGEVLPRVRGFA